jgi:DNA sulfur modification protein DndB
MKLSFPAIKGHMGKRDYYVAMIKLSLVPKLFRFRDWAELPPEQRAQRVIQKSRIPEITQYILDNEDGYLFSSLTASYNCDPVFTPLTDQRDIGILELSFEADLMINDGQHRRAAIEEALKENPTIGDESISVVLFPWEDLDRMQQMFSDLNRTARKTSKSLDILYNHRDLMSQVALAVIERVEAFKGLVDKDRVSLPLRAPKLFTLGSLYDATTALLGSVVEEDIERKTDLAIEFWDTVAENLPEWNKVKSGDLKPLELRQEFIHTHAVVLWAIGSMGQTLISANPAEWKTRLRELRSIDWRRTNREWQGVAMSGHDVINRRQTRMDTASLLKIKMGLTLTPSEERSLLGATDTPSIMGDLRRFVSKTTAVAGE